MLIKIGSFIVAAVLAAASPTVAKDALKLGVTPAIATGIAYVAKHEGIFAKHDLDVELITGNGSVLVAGVVSRSMDIALPTITNYLQAVDSGLPLSIIAGGSINDATESRISLKNGTELKVPADFVGKTVGVSSIGATLHVLFQQWLMSTNVSPSKVNFVEVSFPRMADVIKQGTVDAVVTTEPFGSRIISAGAGVPGPEFTKSLPDDLPILLFVANNGWIAKNGAIITRFRAALAETVALIETDPVRAKAASNVYLKMPDNVIAASQMPKYSVVLKPAQIELWTGMMKPMGLLKTQLVVNDLMK
jgi:NitT/TauT family transport system substrate-binding protein